MSTPRGLKVRPTSDRARESLFNIIGESVIGSSFLDLFAGSGAVGLEAASRDAARVIFVERDTAALKILNRNINSLNAGKKCRVMSSDWLSACRQLSSEGDFFNIIFADPPYGSDLAESCLLSAWTNGILQAGGLMVIEHSRKHLLPPPPEYLKLLRKSTTGEAVFSFYRKEVLP